MQALHDLTQRFQLRLSMCVSFKTNFSASRLLSLSIRSHENPSITMLVNIPILTALTSSFINRDSCRAPCGQFVCIVLSCPHSLSLPRCTAECLNLIASWSVEPKSSSLPTYAALGSLSVFPHDEDQQFPERFPSGYSRTGRRWWERMFVSFEPFKTDIFELV